MMQVLAEFFDAAFWQQLIVTIVGLAVGIPLALWLNRKEEYAEQKRVRDAETERRRQLLDSLRGATERNRALVNQMETELPGQVIFYNVDLTLLDATSAMKYELLENLEFCRAIDHLRFELSHLHRKVDLQLQMFFDGSLRALRVSGSGRNESLGDRLRELVVGSIQKQLKVFPDIFKKIEAELATNQ